MGPSRQLHMCAGSHERPSTVAQRLGLNGNHGGCADFVKLHREHFVLNRPLLPQCYAGRVGAREAFRADLVCMLVDPDSFWEERAEPFSTPPQTKLIFYFAQASSQRLQVHEVQTSIPDKYLEVPPRECGVHVAHAIVTSMEADPWTRIACVAYAHHAL